MTTLLNSPELERFSKRYEEASSNRDYPGRHTLRSLRGGYGMSWGSKPRMAPLHRKLAAALSVSFDDVFKVPRKNERPPTPLRAGRRKHP